MKQRYWLYQRRQTGMYYVEDSVTGKRESLKTRDPRQAERLRDAKNEASEQPMLNLALGRAYYSQIDPMMSQRTWEMVMDDYCSGKKESTRERNKRAFKSPAFAGIRSRKLAETHRDELLGFVKKLKSFNNHIFHRVHNHAVGMGWLPYPIIPPKLWPKTAKKPVRAITAEEHEKILASEKNPERQLYYQLLWETGESQSDAAKLTNANVDWNRRLLIYARNKNGQDSYLVIGSRLEAMLRKMPAKGPLFSKLSTVTSNYRASEFCRRCRVAGIEGVSLHSYRYAWAERAEVCGYPERYAQKALGHASKAVHRAYAKRAVTHIPPLEEYEKQHANIVRLRDHVPAAAEPQQGKAAQ